MKTSPNVRRGLSRLLTANSSLQAAAIALYAALLVSPYLLTGVSTGYDARTHVQYQYHFSDQFWHGDHYPRWLVGSNKGYGSPIFLIQYPLPYFVTAILRPVTHFPAAPDREARELGILAFLTMASAGIACWYWMRRFASPPAATLAALVFLSLPHLLIGVYVQAAIGELCALVFMLLSFGLCESMHRKPASLFPLSISLALLFLSNLLVAILFIPAFLFYGLLSGRQVGVCLSRTVFRLTLSILLGAGTASLYLVPVWMFRGLFDLRAMAANLADFQLGHYFLYVTLGSLRRPRVLLATALTLGLLGALLYGIWRGRRHTFVRPTIGVLLALAAITVVPNLGLALIRFSGFPVSASASWELFSSKLALAAISTMTLGLLAIAWSPHRPGSRQLALLSIAGVAFAMMLPMSAVIWRAVPGLQVLQFPFRFGGILTVAVAGLIAGRLDTVILRDDGKTHRVLWAYALAVAAVVFIGVWTFRIDDILRRPSPPVRYDLHRDIDIMYRTYVAPAYLSAFAEAMGSRPEAYSAIPTPGDGTLRMDVVGGDNCVRVVAEGARTLVVTADCEGPVRLQIGQLNFPLWRKIQMADAPEGAVLETSRSGLMELWLAPGKQSVRLKFDSAAVERWGVAASAGSLLISSIGYVVLRRRSKAKPVHGLLADA